jgi:hypothetical protein
MEEVDPLVGVRRGVLDHDAVWANVLPWEVARTWLTALHDRRDLPEEFLRHDFIAIEREDPTFRCIVKSNVPCSSEIGEWSSLLGWRSLGNYMRTELLSNRKSVIGAPAIDQDDLS